MDLEPKSLGKIKIKVNYELVISRNYKKIRNFLKNSLFFIQRVIPTFFAVGAFL